MGFPLLMRRSLLLAFLSFAACAAPPSDESGGDQLIAEQDRPVVADPRVRTVQLYQTGNEQTLPVLALRQPGTLTLEFDVVGDRTPLPLRVSFSRDRRPGEAELLTTEYLTGFDSDEIVDRQPSGTTVVPYVHYRYTFPNSGLAFTLGGVYRLRVETSDGTPLVERTFFVDEGRVRAEVRVGTRLAETGATARSIQPSARLLPEGDLEGADAFLFEVCFLRDGDLSDLRCAPEPSLVEQAVYGFYLPRSRAFPPARPLYQFDLGVLGLGPEIESLEFAARPPGAVLEPDLGAFGGEVLGAALADEVVIDGAYRDGGNPDDDAEYVEVAFRYVPQDARPVGASVHVVGGFLPERRSEQNRLEWVPEAKRYEGTVLVKQGRYVYSYLAPAPRTPPVALGQPSVFTALVFYRDPTRFASRLVGVESIITR